MPNINAIGHLVSEKKLFKDFPIEVYVKLICPGVGAIFGPMGHDLIKLVRGLLSDTICQI